MIEHRPNSLPDQALTGDFKAPEHHPEHQASEAGMIWRDHLLNPSAPVDVDAISDTVESVFEALTEHGPGGIKLGGLAAERVSGEHLAAILRSTSCVRDQIAGWDAALGVAAAALSLAGIDVADALYGLGLTDRQAREAEQRARMAERFKGRKPTPATADFDLPAGQDARGKP